MDIDAYLGRIGYEGSREPDARTLAALQRAHLRSVPFEALSCYRGEPIVLEPEALFDKIVAGGRGGFCFELNGSFAALLARLDFEVTLLSARPVMSHDGALAPEFAHLALLVEADDERWLADVGFGHFTPLEPLRLDDEGDQLSEGLLYRISRDGDTWTASLDETGVPTSGGYRFTLQPRALSDFAERCRAYATEPDSPFVTSAVYTRFEPARRVTVTRTRTILTEGGAHTQEPIADDDAWLEALFRLHGVRL